jgi:hypothetical protein
MWEEEEEEEEEERAMALLVTRPSWRSFVSFAHPHPRSSRSILHTPADSLLPGGKQRYAVPEMPKQLKHAKRGTVSFSTQWSGPIAEGGIPSIGSQFFLTLARDPPTYLDGRHAIFGEVVEGLEVLDKLDAHLCDAEGIPFRDIR